MSIESIGSISTADGSALVRMGNTTVICGVKAEIAEPDLDREEEGFLGDDKCLFSNGEDLTLHADANSTKCGSPSNVFSKI